MGRIEDDELRELFKIESQEHIQGLEKGLLRLETNPSDISVLEEVFREAHSLKGSAHMVGVMDVEHISHRLEDILGSVRKGTVLISSGMIDGICRALDAVKKLVNEAVTGEPSGVDVSATIEFLEAGQIPPQPPLFQSGGVPSPPFFKVGEFPAPLLQSGGDKTLDTHDGVKSGVAGTAGAEPEAGHGHEYRIDTVRVDTARLDELVTLTGELIVFRTRLHNRLKGVDEAVEALAEIIKEASKGAATGAGPVVSRAIAPYVLERINGFSHILSRLKEAAYEDASRFDFIAQGLDEGVKQLRLLPFSTLFNLFPRAVRDMAREAGKDVTLHIDGGETGADKRILEEMKDPLMHMLRNAVVHGIEVPSVREGSGKPASGAVRLRAFRTESNIVVEVSDDGRGLDIEEIKKVALKRKLRAEEAMVAMNAAEIRSLIFAPGFSTSAFVTEAAGRGVGLDVVKANVERLKGAIEVESATGTGCTFRVRLPITLATAKMLIVEDRGRRYAITMDSVYKSIRLKSGDIFPIEGREAMTHEGVCISVVRLSDILELPVEHKAAEAAGAAKKEGFFSCVIISSGEDRLGILVDELLDEQEVVLKPDSTVLKRVRNVAGATILGSGEVCMILNPSDMMKSVHKRHAAAPPEPRAAMEERKKIVLLVEDSITTRTQEKRILEGGGYEVVVAVDGLDAMSKIPTRRFDAVVSDIMMPNMDGLALTVKIRQDKRYKDIPVILVTTLASADDKKKGLEAGANAYIPKPAFDQKIFLDTLRRLV